jgi:hypothetical protein
MLPVMFPPFPLSFVAVLLHLIRVGRLVDHRQGNGRDADEAPAFIRLLDHFSDHQRHQSADGSRPVADCAGPVMRMPGIVRFRFTLVAVMWLWCARFHCTHRLWRENGLVKCRGQRTRHKQRRPGPRGDRLSSRYSHLRFYRRPRGAGFRRCRRISRL